jgi:hypothetical protein
MPTMATGFGGWIPSVNKDNLLISDLAAFSIRGCQRGKKMEERA